MIDISCRHSRGCADDCVAGGPERSYLRGPGRALGHCSCLCTSPALTPSSALPCTSILVPLDQSSMVSMGSGTNLHAKIECQPPPFLPSLFLGPYERLTLDLSASRANRHPPTLLQAVIPNVSKGYSTSKPTPTLFSVAPGKRFLFKVISCITVISFAGKRMTASIQVHSLAEHPITYVYGI